MKLYWIYWLVECLIDFIEFRIILINLYKMEDKCNRFYVLIIKYLIFLSMYIFKLMLVKSGWLFNSWLIDMMMKFV